MRKSFKEFFDTTTKEEREQLLATYLSRQHRDFVMMRFPAKKARRDGSLPKGKRGWRSRK